MPAATFFRNAVCNVLRATTLNAIGGFVALYNGDPGGAGSEVTTTIRVAGRVSVTFNAPTNGVMTSSAIVSFGNAAAGATVSHFAIFDAASAGNMVFYAALTNGTQTISSGNPVSFAAGAIQVTVT
jgi:hypothetical protein